MYLQKIKRFEQKFEFRKKHPKVLTVYTLKIRITERILPRRPENLFEFRGFRITEIRIIESNL